MSNLQVKKATRKQVKLRLGLSGPSGSGKTYSALLMAYGIASDWGKIAVIDTENESASLYTHLGEFLTLDLSAPYSPERYIEAIKACENAGAEVIIIDSASHEWNGIGGCIDINEKLAQSKFKGNTWSAWSETTPRHDRFIEAVTQSSCHMILCARSKTETVMGDDKKVKKIGTKEIQREGFEYEFTLFMNIDRDTHMAIASKDRTELFERRDPFIINALIGKEILDWCLTGVDQKKLEIEHAFSEMKNCPDMVCLKAIWSKYKLLQTNQKFIEAKDQKKLEIEHAERVSNEANEAFDESKV